MTVERRWNSEATIIDPPPHEPVDHDRQCPTRLRHKDGIWPCHHVIRAGRTKHGTTHDFHADAEPEPDYKQQAIDAVRAVIHTWNAYAATLPEGQHQSDIDEMVGDFRNALGDS